MSAVSHGSSADATFSSIVDALERCYVDLAEPDFRNVYVTMGSALHRNLIESLRAKGIEIQQTTDENDDVSNQLVASQFGDQVGVGLSGVGPFATLVHQDGDGRYFWVTRPDTAPTPLAALVAGTVGKAVSRCWTGTW